MEEFLLLMTIGGILNENFVARDVNTIYTVSMMTQINEIDKDRHLNMSLVEFLEGLARVAEKINIIHFLEEDKDPLEQPLSWKIEALIIRLVKHTMPSPYFNSYI